MKWRERKRLMVVTRGWDERERERERDVEDDEWL